jgi:superfamily II DNA or RNA helicase
LIVAPTGSGKTVVFAEIAEQRRKNGRVLILAHREELLSQAQDKLHKANGIVSDLEKADSQASLDADVVVASIQTLSREHRLKRFSPDHFSTIIVDEAHHVLSDTYQRILTYFRGAKVLGVTATPDRSDARSLGRFFEDIAFQISLVDLIKQDYLCRVKVQTVPVRIDISKVSTRAGDFSDEELAAVLEPVLEELAEAIVNYAKGRKTLVFVPLVRIAKQFAEILCQKGLAAEMISGVCSDRAEKLSRFRTGETQLLVNAMLLTEGFDEPGIDCIVPLRPTRIRSLYAQQVGRGTRIHPGKDNLLLLDFLWLSRQHNLVKPVDLIAADDNERAAIGQVLDEAEGDLVEALDTSRERALARQILAQRKLKGEVKDLLDIVDLCINYKAPELENYAPTMHWHSRELTPKQIEYLRRYRVNLNVVRDRGHASAIIDSIRRYNESIPATPRQLGYLRWRGYQGDLSKVSKPAAARLIGQLKEGNEVQA